MSPNPPDFKVVHDGWNDFTTRMTDIILGDGTPLPAPAQIMAWLDVSRPTLYNPVKAANAWQTYLNIFKDKDFVAGVMDMFCQPNAPRGVPWQYPDDIEKFGTVGTSIGGFAPMFPISFVDMMRFTLNKLEVCQAQIVSGVSSVTDALADCTFQGKTDTVRQHIRTSTPITNIVPANDLSTLDLYSNGQKVDGGFTHLVVATPHRSAEIELQIDPRWQNPVNRQSTADSTRLISMDTREAVTNLHIAESSKLFIKVKPWWRTDSTRIRCISADTTLANFYTLDYEDPDEAICLVNYTWEDFSEKSEALGPLNVRYQRLLDDLKNLAPDYVLQGMPPEATADNGVMIDWQKEPHYYGAFQLTRPVQEKLLSTLFYDFQVKATPDGLAKIYFVGDSYTGPGDGRKGRSRPR